MTNIYTYTKADWEAARKKADEIRAIRAEAEGRLYRCSMYDENYAAIKAEANALSIAYVHALDHAIHIYSHIKGNIA